MTLWLKVLPVIQSINDNGGNFTSIIINRSVICLIDNAADNGELPAVNARNRILHAIDIGKWPHDPPTFNYLFESYHEGLFYLLAKHRGVGLRHIQEVKGKTPDFAVDSTGENYEVKTLDLSGSTYAYPPIAEEGRRRQAEALEEAKIKGIGTAVSSINPHGNENDWEGVMQRVMRQIGQNIKAGQFEERPTILVVSLARTSIHSGADELIDYRIDPHLGPVNGHLWTLAAHKVGETFWWPHPNGFQLEGGEDNDNGPLQQNGILRDFNFVQGIVFIDTILHELGSADLFDPGILDKAYRLHGIWNDAFVPIGQSASVGASSSFFMLCHKIARMS